MNRANQNALFQATNQAVLGIRQLEINYYSNLYGVFGTQAILIGGFVYGTFTQNNTDPDNPYEKVFVYLYFVCAALTIATAVHIMLCTMILQVYGPGLALHGPLGSMARATEGLQVEQEQVIYSFVLMICGFALSTVWVFWTVMSTREAFTCTAVFIIAARQWYFYSERIYLRFYWNKNDTNWNNGDVDTDMEFDQEPGAAAATSANPMHTDAPSGPQYKEKKLNFPFNMSFKKKDGSGNEKAGAVGTESEGPSTPTEADNAAKGTGDAKVELGSNSSKSMIAMEGYFTTRGRSEQQVILEARRWDRLYFVLFRTGEYYIYKSRQSFRTDPKTPIYIRPLRLSDFFVKVDNTDEELRKEYDDDGRTVMSATSTVRGKEGNSSKPPAFRFQITLIPRENEEYDARSQFRNHWLLRVDTEEELEIWLGAIRDVCPSCFRD